MFYALHRHEVLQRPQYQRLQVGIIKGEESVVVSKVRGELSAVPYAEPTWLSKGYHSPYYKEVGPIYHPLPLNLTRRSQSHRRLQKAMREFVDDVIYPDALVCH